MPDLGPEIVSEEGLRELLGLGYQVVVVCTGEPSRKAGVWYGLWHILCASMDGKTEKVLVSFRREDDGTDKPRSFKTCNGLIGFLYSLGLRTLTLPMERGGRVGHNLRHHGARSS